MLRVVNNLINTKKLGIEPTNSISLPTEIFNEYTKPKDSLVTYKDSTITLKAGTYKSYGTDAPFEVNLESSVSTETCQSISPTEATQHPCFIFCVWSSSFWLLMGVPKTEIEMWLPVLGNNTIKVGECSSLIDNGGGQHTINDFIFTYPN